MTHRQLLKDKMTISSILTKHFPKYEITIPSTGESVWFRPFLVKEEKKLLIVQEFGTEKEIIKSEYENRWNEFHKKFKGENASKDDFIKFGLNIR